MRRITFSRLTAYLLGHIARLEVEREELKQRGMEAEKWEVHGRIQEAYDMLLILSTGIPDPNKHGGEK